MKAKCLVPRELPKFPPFSLGAAGCLGSGELGSSPATMCPSDPAAVWACFPMNKQDESVVLSPVCTLEAAGSFKKY